MATNQVSRGDILDYTSVGAVASGAVIKLANTVGVALKAAAGAGELIAVAIEGVFQVPKVSGRAWVIGEKLFWDVSTSSFDTVAGTAAAGDVTGCAVVAAPAASGDTTGQVKLTPGNTAIT